MQHAKRHHAEHCSNQQDERQFKRRVHQWRASVGWKRLRTDVQKSYVWQVFCFV
jgi:hypothetical protein